MSDIESLNNMLAIGVAVAVFLIWLSFYPENLNFLINRITNADAFNATEIKTKQKKYRLFELLLPISQKIAKKNNGKVNIDKLKKIDDDLDAAGRPLHMKAIEFYNMKYAGAIVFGLAFGLVGMSYVGNPFIPGAIGALVGFVFPNNKLQQTIKQRSSQIDMELPNILDLVSVCMASGMTLLKSIETVCEQNDGELVDELKIVVADLNRGASLIDSFGKLSKRCRTKKIRQVYQNVKLSEELGTEIAEQLKFLSKDIRKSTFEVVKQRATKAAILVLFPVLIFIFPALAIILMGPIVPAFLNQ